MKASKRPLAIFRMQTVRRIGKFILRVRTIVINMTNNAAIFTAPVPVLATVTTDTNDLEAAEGVAETRVVGAAAARNLKYDIVLADVRNLQSYVQSLADAAPNEAAAIAIIQASGFDLKNHGARVKPDISVRNSKVQGQLLLYAKAVPDRKRATYEWQMSPDGNVWATTEITLGTRAIINKLQSGTKLFFRVRAITKEGALDWSAAVSIIVD